MGLLLTDAMLVAASVIQSLLKSGVTATFGSGDEEENYTDGRIYEPLEESGQWIKGYILPPGR